MSDKIEDNLSYKIIGCAMQVHAVLGNGFPERIYQRALALELKDAGLKFLQEKEITIFYKGIPIGTRRADFLIENEIILELKAVIELDDGHLAQGLNYLTAYNLNKGLLLNFGAPSLEIKRLRPTLKQAIKKSNPPIP